MCIQMLSKCTVATGGHIHLSVVTCIGACAAELPTRGFIAVSENVSWSEAARAYFRSWFFVDLLMVCADWVIIILEVAQLMQQSFTAEG
eukprot:864123-Amphidinium_carterae.1